MAAPLTCVVADASPILTGPVRATVSARVRPGRPRRPTADVQLAVSTPDQLFHEALPIVDGVVREVARRYRLSPEDHEDFRAAVRVRLLEDDCAILRKFERRASLSTYLRIVITRAFLDQRVREWGRWRPSAEALRLGAVAVDLERLLERQHLPLEEAIASLRSRNATLDEAHLRALASQLPPRVTGRRLVEEAELQHVAADGAATDHLVVESEAAQASVLIATALRAATAGLAPRARLLLRLRFEQGSSIADVARLLREPQKPLYREFERLLRDLRSALEAGGVSPDHVLAVLGQPGGGLDGALVLEPAAKDGDPSVSLGAHPGDSRAVAE